MEKTQKFIKDRVTLDKKGCWLWNNYLTKSGYAVASFEGKITRVHRFSYESFIKKIPKGLVIDHLCRVRHCVNPDHLETVTQRENLHRSTLTLTYLHKIKTHCVHGHPFSKKNTYIIKGPYGKFRMCRTCSLARSKLRKQKERLLTKS